MGKPRSASAPAPTLVFTGILNDHHCRVYIHGKPVDLTPAPYLVLVELAVQLADPDGGFLHAARNDISRIRKAITKAAGADIGKSFIQTCGHDLYCLPIRREDCKAQIGVTKCFAGYVRAKIVTKRHVRKLRRLGHVVPLP